MYNDELNLNGSASFDLDNHRGRGDFDDTRTHASAPSQLEDIQGGCAGVGDGGNKALAAVLNALSNYSKDEQGIEGFDTMGHQRSSGWGVESSVEGSKEWDRPIVLRGPNGILTRHRHQEDGTNNEDNFDSPYRVMEDLDIETNVCRMASRLCEIFVKFSKPNKLLVFMSKFIISSIFVRNCVSSAS